MPLVVEMSGEYHPIVGRTVAKAVESITDNDPYVTFDKIINMDDRRIAKVIGKHIEKILGQTLV